MDPTDGIPFVAVLCVEGYETGDGRYLEPGMGSWRAVPLALQMQTTQPETGGHAGAVIAARIDTIRMDGRRMIAEGVFDNSPEGNEFARLVHERMLRYVSIDMADAEVTIEPVEFDDEGYPTETRARFGPYQIMGATGTAHPAIDLAVIWLKSDPAPEESFAELPEPLGPPVPMPAMEDVLILASGSPTLALIAAGVVRPPAGWFTDPGFSELTPLSVTDEGRVFGHIAPWGCCHIGFLNKCVEPPQGGDYSRFLVGQVVTEEGTEIATGTITAYGGHADERLNEAGARAHHDDVSMACADVTIGEDKYGIWAAGSLRPGVTDEQIRVMRASAPSGDWRPIGGRLELINIHYVNTPGFPVPRLRATVASGELVGLTASIGHEADTMEKIGEATGEPRVGVEVPLGETGELNVPDDAGDPEPIVPTEPPAEPDPVEDRLSKIEHAISPLLESQRDEILSRHPAPPEPSPLERYVSEHIRVNPDTEG
jgi:hypothetical protein